MHLTFQLHKSADFIFDYLTDMQKFASVHPVITRMDQTGPNSYRVHETLKLGFIPFSFTYPATIHSHPGNQSVVMQATVFKLTKITMRFELKPDGDKTMVEEFIDFQSILPVKSTMRKVFQKQHSLFFRKLDSLTSTEP